MNKTQTNKFNYGRYNWKMQFPNISDVKTMSDEDLHKYYKDLPPALGNQEKARVLNAIVSEVKLRYKQQTTV